MVQSMQDFIHRMIQRTDSSSWLNQRGGIFVLHDDQISEAERTLLDSVARVVLDSANGPLAEQLSGLQRHQPALPVFEPTLSADPLRDAVPPLTRPTDLQFDNGLGGFNANDEYVVYLHPGEMTPAPWINVIANADFGCLVSETGAGYTWAVNSGENRLTSWRNDPVSDMPAEAIYLRDEETAEVWSPTPQPAPAAAPYLVRHGAGYSIFEHNSHGVQQRVRVFVAPDAPIKVVQLRLENSSLAAETIHSHLLCGMGAGRGSGRNAKSYRIGIRGRQLCPSGAQRLQRRVRPTRRLFGRQ